LADYAALHIKFIQQGKFVTLQGDASNSPVPAQLNHIRRLHHTNSIAEIYTLNLIQPEAEVSSLLQLLDTMEPELALLIHRYKSVSSIPVELPPPRTHDHSIPLLEGSNPAKVKPYRYPHSRKEEIEKMVQDMLIDGIIQPSGSPFSPLYCW